MIDRVKVEQCYICDACVTICPTKAISKEKCRLDFFYPQIDPVKCIACNQCESVCPALTTKVFNSPKSMHKAWIAWNPDEDKRRLSTSGGVFIELAEKVLGNNGYVCGAVFDRKFRVHHILSNRREDVLRMMGSKYVQSDMQGIYEQIQTLLEEQKEILFSGCPCQVAALHYYLGKDYSNLLCVEVVCHGISSPMLWEKYLCLREKIHYGKIKTASFRAKRNGWHESSVFLEFDNGKEYQEAYYRDAFSGAMVKNITLKESCYQCKYKGFASGADITLGDFWGANVEMPELDDDKGLSAVITHHIQAEKLLQSLNIELRQYELQRLIKYNRGIVESAPRSMLREVFYQAAERKGYTYAMKKYLFELRRQKAIRLFKSKIRVAARTLRTGIKGIGK